MRYYRSKRERLRADRERSGQRRQADDQIERYRLAHSVAEDRCQNRQPEFPASQPDQATEKADSSAATEHSQSSWVSVSLLSQRPPPRL